MNRNFNLEIEYSSFLDSLERHISELSDEAIEHFGVKGMKWGVRKDRPAREPLKSLGPDEIVRKTSSGETIILSKDPPTRLHNLLGRMSKKYREEYASAANLTLRNKDGKKVGEATVHKKNDDELYLVWLGINRSERGKGYATAVMKAAEEFGREIGVKRMTLEVPGNSPDARHIYEKLGFKFVSEVDGGAKDPIWGGLSNMVYNFDETQHGGRYLMDEKPSLDELIHFGVLGMKWGVHRDRPNGVSRSVDKDARKDAEEFARAKMFYGEGAGNRRKLIKATVEGKSKKDPNYKRAFDKHLENQDMDRHASKAKKERKRTDVVKGTAKTARGIRNVLNGNAKFASMTAALAVGGYMYARKSGIDKVVASAAKNTFKTIRNGALMNAGKLTVTDFLK